MGTDRNRLSSIRDILQNLFKDGALPFDPDDAAIWTVWDKVVGPGISGHARPSWIRNKMLRVTVSDPIWVQELRFFENDIIEKLNKKLGRSAVDKIEFRVGRK